MAEVNVVIIKLEKTLDEIIPLFQNRTFKAIEELAGLNVSEENKSCIAKWEEIDGTGFKKECIDINNIKYEYIQAKASIEIVNVNKNKREMLSERVELDKKLLVETKKSIVYFVNYLGCVYGIIIGPKEMESRIRSRLMHCRRKESEWGNIYSTNLQEYSFSKNFYYWVIDKKQCEISDGNSKANIIDVKGFKSDTERETSSISGQGSHIDKRIPLKSILGMGERLINLYIKMNYNGITYGFVLHNDGRLTVYSAECGLFGVTNPRMLNIRECVFSIYFEIIPFLKKVFSSEVTLKNWEVHEKRIRKTYALEVIRTLMKDNNIEIKELEAAIGK